MPNATPESLPTDLQRAGGLAHVQADEPKKTQSAKRAVVVVEEDAGDGDGDTEDEDDGEEDVEDVVEDEDQVFEFPEDLEDVELINSRLQSSHLQKIRWPQDLKRLCLRQNQITYLDSDDFATCNRLEELDLYDNKIKDIGHALDGKNELSVLDLSYNVLRAIPETLQNLKSLKTVYFIQNRISKINGLSNLGLTLRSLELGGNKIRTIENLDMLVNLEELWLGKNKIVKLEGLHALSRLKILSIQSNRITKLEGLGDLKTLEELYVSHNGIKRLEGLDTNLNLRVLDFGNNFIPQIENISHLTHLEEFWASNNKIADLTQLESQLRNLNSLETVYLEGNPCQKNDMTGYRRKIMLALPQIKQIDATYVKQV